MNVANNKAIGTSWRYDHTAGQALTCSRTASGVHWAELSWIRFLRKLTQLNERRSTDKAGMRID